MNEATENGNGHIEVTDSLPRLLMTHKGIPYSWWIMPELRERIRTFQVEHGVDLDADVLLDAFDFNFSRNHPGMVAIVAIFNDQIVGHVLISLEEADDGKVVKIRQLQVDEGFPDGLMEPGIAMIVDWAKTRYARKLFAEVKSESRARLFERLGLQRRGILLERML